MIDLKWDQSDGGESPGSMFRSGKLLGQQVRKAGEGGRTARGVMGRYPGLLHVTLRLGSSRFWRQGQV